MNIDDFLRRVPLFSGLRPADYSLLARALRPRTVKKGVVLFQKGNIGTTLFIIRSGSIKIVLPSEEGEEVVLTIFGPGDFFGEMSLLDGMPRSADAIAMENTELLALNRTDFLFFLKNNAPAIQAVLSSLSMRLRKTDELLEDTCFLNISARFAKKLVELAEMYGKPTGEKEEILIDLDLTQRDLASMVGATRESINKQLRLLREKGMVSIVNNKIRIPDIDSIRRTVDD
jgi:CRP/FNR family transcriptional regulator, cyclic AMP receptor protein